MDADQKWEENFKVNIGLKVLTKEKYHSLGAVAKGSYGIVLKLQGPDKKTVAAKFVSPERVREQEADFWKNFDHRNVLPLLDIVDTPFKRIFLMPFYSHTLRDFLISESFCAHPAIFEMLKQWLLDIFRGVEYLHGLGVCHLDLKSDNVLATREPKAVICDFGFVTSTDAPISRCGLPAYLRPPEACQSIGRIPEVDGRAFDVWSVGQLAIQLFTRQTFYSWTDIEDLHEHRWNQPLGNINYFPELVYPKLYPELQPKEFELTVEGAFPSVKNWGYKISQALNLVRCILRYNPMERPRFERLKNHVLFKDDEGVWLQDDPMWKEWKMFNATLAPIDTPEASPRPNSVQTLKVAKHGLCRNGLTSCDIPRVYSEPIVMKKELESRAAVTCIQSDSAAVLKDRVDGNVYWDAHEGIFADQPRKKKKGGIRGWLRKKFRGLLSGSNWSCLRIEED